MDRVADENAPSRSQTEDAIVGVATYFCIVTQNYW